MLRLLARAAGGAVAPEGILALLGFNALFYFNILLSVTVFLTVLLTLSRWYRDSEMIVWFTSGQALTACLRPILWFAAPFFVAIVVLSLFLSPWAEQRKLEYERQLESRDEIALLTPGLFREFRRANLVVFVESINTFDGTIRNVFLHSVDDGKDVDDGRALGHAAGGAERRPVHRAERRPPLRRQARHRRVPDRRVRAARAPDRAGGAAGAADVDQGDPDRRCCIALDGPVERAELFWRLSVPISALVLTLLAVPLAYVNPRMGRSFNLIAAAFLYMLYSNCLNIVQSFIAQGKLGFLAGPRAAARDRDRRRAAALRPSAVAVRRLPPRDGAEGRAGMKTLTRYIGREVLAAILLIFSALVMLFAFFDLIHELGDVGRGGYTISAALLFVALQLPSRMYELFPGRGADRHAVRAGAARREFGVHGDARVGRVAAAGRLGADARRHSARDRHVSRRRVRRAAGRAARAAGPRAGAGRHGAHRRAAVPVGLLVQAGPDLRQHPQRARRPDARRRAHLRVRPRLAADAPCAPRNREASPATASGSSKDVRTTEIAPTGTTRRREADSWTWDTVLRPSLLTVYQVAPEKLELNTLWDNMRAARQRHAEDVALRDRVLEQGVLSGRRARDDDRRAAVLVLPAPAGRRRLPDLRRHDARAHVLPDRPAVLEPRRAERLAAALLGGVSAGGLRRAHGGAALVARAAVDGAEAHAARAAEKNPGTSAGIFAAESPPASRRCRSRRRLRPRPARC